jgi:tripartite-type tricarboxylate transporter receptor subunit TctC
MIDIRRSTRFALALGAGFIAAVAGTSAQAQAYPNKPIRFVIGFPAGSATDITFRPIMEHMSQTLGQNVIIDARPGGGGTVGAQYVKSQPGDGYTFYLASNALVSVALRSKGEIDLRRDYSPIAPVTVSPLVLGVTSTLKINSLKDLIDEARANPGKINYASYGVGSGAHVFMELLLSEAKVNMVHVPYQGTAQATTDTAEGRVQVTGTILATARPHVASMGGSGKLRLIAVSTGERSPLAPDLPGMRESGFPQIDFPLWGGFVGPAGIPRPIVDTLARASAAAYKDPKIIEMAAKFGQTPVYGGPEDLSRIMLREYDATAKLIKEAGLKIE